ncbi:hypothetical protein Fmac_027862 [Flemingia macrophylla]|uniref:Amino acid transporter transmembrane domain-containing protein n=1 Tax=Flemingia macrophylla TaxID=520843 RepID=A0ABD1LJ52_9FABA
MGSTHDSEESVSEEAVSVKGTWKHAAFHVATTIATPAAYAPLPFALASLGWPLGFWGYWSVAFFQQVASLGNNIAIQIAAGSSLKAIYKNYHENGTLTLQHFVIFFGIFELLLSQLPDIHSLRWVNAVCTFCTIGFAGTTIGVTIYNGKKIDRTSVSYSLQGSSASKTFKAFNALGTIAFSFGDAMLPEIQNTVKEPAKRNMHKSISAAYSVIILTYWQLAFSGYWAFGSEVPSLALQYKTMPFFGDFVSICGAIGFTPLDFVFPALAYLKAGRTVNNSKLSQLMQPLNILIATWFSIVAILGCIGAVRFIVEDIKNYKFFHDM